MAAIGLIILAKQLHVMLGYAPVAKNPVMLFAELPRAIMNMQPAIFVVGALSLATLYLWPKNPVLSLRRIPAPLVSVIVGVVLAGVFGFTGKTLLQVPADVTSWLIFPDFSIMRSWDGWRVALTLAMVASLETTLSAAAVDKLDPAHRRSNLDRDLLSKGVCNMLSASVGGLPMIAEIVRSSANVSYGATSWRANFSHGVLILAAVMLLPSALAFIPLASLAAILVMVGSRLGSPAHFAHAKKVGLDHLTGFFVTMGLTLAVDLLVGIFAGIIAQYTVEVFLGLRVKHTFGARYREKEDSGVHHFTVKSALMFSNFEALKARLVQAMHAGHSVHLELSVCEYVDSNVMEQIKDMQKDAQEKGLSFVVNYSDTHAPMGSESNSAIKRIA